MGVDIDKEMLAVAKSKGPGSVWRVADLSTVQLGRTFDLIVIAGNVMIFLAPGTEAKVVANMAAHLAPGGRLVAGFQLQAGRLTVGQYDQLAASAGLALEERWSTWDRAEWQRGDTYALSVHRKPV